MPLDSITALVSRFSDHLSEYKSGAYNETQVRRDFLVPLFESLGRDVFKKRSVSQPGPQVLRMEEQ